MYKLLLCWRYLRTRYIALASIISVTLGVATLIVVNSVMDGFTVEMHHRLNDGLSDIVFEGRGLNGFPDPEWHKEEIRKVLGDDLKGITATVVVPAMFNLTVQGESMMQHGSLIGIDPQSYGTVSDFPQYLLHAENRERLSFALRDEGYDNRLPPSGWNWRRKRITLERDYLRQMQEAERLRREALGEPVAMNTLPAAETPVTEAAPETAGPIDPFQRKRQAAAEEHVFDEMKQQHPGVVLGIGIASHRYRGADKEVKDIFYCRPGDDIQISFPTAGQPQIVADNFTVVDFYESKMSEYDHTFAFVPLDHLQEMRGMVDPLTGVPSVTQIQIRLHDGVDLEAAQQKLYDRFPPQQFGYSIRTWQQLQGPLLQAVQMETTLLNILLFLIIAVAGFGILATFFMIVVEKTRDIGVLKSLGASSRGVMTIFLTYGFSLGIVGSGVGILIGLLFVVYINTIAAGLEWVTGRPVFDPTVYYFQQIPTVIEPFTVGWIALGSVCVAIVASVLPALRAARLHPVEALRYE